MTPYAETGSSLTNWEFRFTEPADEVRVSRNQSSTGSGRCAASTATYGSSRPVRGTGRAELSGFGKAETLIWKGFAKKLDPGREAGASSTMNPADIR